MYCRFGEWRGVVAICALLIAGSAMAADVPPLDAPRANVVQRTDVVRDSFRDRFEFRFGGGAHGVGSIESGTVDLNAELIFPQLHLFDWQADPSLAWLMPRINVGGMANLSGRTSYLYAGFLWTYEFTNRLFLEGFLGGAVHNGSINGDPANHMAALGCHQLFHVGTSLGYRVTSQWSMMFTFAHVSNGNAVLDGCGRNQGLNEYLVRAGYSF
jgi:hypothetical protein